MRGNDHLVWQVEVGNGGDVREFVFVDAHTGKVVDQITGVTDALNRRAYRHDRQLPGHAVLGGRRTRSRPRTSRPTT